MAAIKTEEDLCAKYRTRTVVMNFYGIGSPKTFAKKIKEINHLLPKRALLSPSHVTIIVNHLAENNPRNDLNTKLQTAISVLEKLQNPA